MLLRYFSKSSLFKNSLDWAIVVLRIIPSFYLFYYHGYKKLVNGAASWEWLGKAALTIIGIDFGHVFFGFLAAVSEGILTWMVIIGLFTRLSCIFLMITMFFAGLYHLVGGDSPEYAFIYLSIYLGVFLLGSGKYSIDNYLNKKL